MPEPLQPKPQVQSTAWQDEQNTWDVIKAKFGITENRYESFTFLKYLDLDDKYVKNYVYYHLGKEQPIIIGRMSKHIEFWKTLHTPDWVLSIIEHGFKIPFLRKPPRMFFQNNKSALINKNKVWVLEQINEFENAGFIERVDYIPYCVLPLQVKESSSKKSLIHDASALNAYVDKSKFKIESWDVMFEYAVDSEYAIKYDLKKYYYHIGIHLDYQKFFGFSFEINGKVIYFIWKCLPYGYTLGPLIARHIMKPLITFWRSLKIKNACFFDDGMACDSDFEFLKKASLQIHCDLIRAGLIPGLEKCTWHPVRILDWNGLTFDFGKKCLFIKADRIIILKSLLSIFLRKWPNVSYREISQLTGTLNSMYPVLNGLEQLYTRQLQTFINIRHFKELKWDSIINTDTPVLYSLCLKELKFWLQYLDTVNFRNFKPNIPTRLGWVDASSYASGGIIIELNSSNMTKLYSVDRKLDIQNNSVIRHVDFVYSALEKCNDIKCFVVQHRMLTKEEKSLDSNERELIGALHLVKSNIHFLKNSVFTLHLDNENAHLILTKGSVKPRLHQYAIEINELCLANNIQLYTVGIPRIINETADCISKFYDKEDYSCTNEFFLFAQSQFGIECNYDRFASNTNTKCLRFNSLTNCIGTSGIDCFKYHWGSPSINWLFPPPRLVLKSINHLRECKGIGILLLPDWKTADFYAVVMKLDISICKIKRFSGKNVFEIGSDPTSHFSKDFNAAVLVCLLNFNL